MCKPNCQTNNRAKFQPDTDLKRRIEPLGFLKSEPQQEQEYGNEIVANSNTGSFPDPKTETNKYQT